MAFVSNVQLAVAAHLFAGKSSLIEQPVTSCTTMHVQMGPHHANAWIFKPFLEILTASCFVCTPHESLQCVIYKTALGPSIRDSPLKGTRRAHKWSRYRIFAFQWISFPGIPLTWGTYFIIEVDTLDN